MTDSSSPDFLVLGTILKPRGLKGEVKAGIFFYRPDQLPGFSKVYLEKGSRWEPFAVSHSVVRGGFWYITFEGVDRIEKAEALRGARIALPAGEVKNVPENFYFSYQLRGLTVIDASGKVLGVVKQVTNHAAVDFLTVEGESIISIPMSESIVESVDESAGKLKLKVNWE